MRQILAYGDYFPSFRKQLTDSVHKKFKYVFSILETQERISKKFVKLIRDGIYEIRVDADGNIYRVFFIFDEGNIIVLFNGFQKKTQKTPEAEIRKAIEIKNKYFEEKQNETDQHI